MTNIIIQSLLSVSISFGAVYALSYISKDSWVFKNVDKDGLKKIASTLVTLAIVVTAIAAFRIIYGLYAGFVY